MKTIIANYSTMKQIYSDKDFPTSLVQQQDNDSYWRSRRVKRSYNINETYDANANETSLYIKLMLVIDNDTFRKLLDEVSMIGIYTRYRDIVREVNVLFQRFNIFVALVDIKMWTNHNEIVIETSASGTLDNFLTYSRKFLGNGDVDLVYLMTNIEFDNDVLGMAYKDELCNQNYNSGVVHQRANFPDYETVGTLAHEIAHNIGIEHDHKLCVCPNKEQCVMSPWNSPLDIISEWSSCSIESIGRMLEKNELSCLNEKPKRVLSSLPTCGNGEVELGEECDCGIRMVGTMETQNCINPSCCNRTTCMLSINASCASGECCDFETCQFRQAGTVCRAKSYDCDSLYCDGVQEHCPNDAEFKSDGEKCSQEPLQECNDRECNGTAVKCLNDCDNNREQTIHDDGLFVIIYAICLLFSLLLCYFLRNKRIYFILCRTDRQVPNINQGNVESANTIV